MSLRTIFWNKNTLCLLDQTALPKKVSFIVCRDARRVFESIRRLAVRGAPAIGVAAAFGVCLGVKHTKSDKAFLKDVSKTCSYLLRSRPTAVNLKWALDRMRRCALQYAAGTLPQKKAALLREAMRIYLEEKAMCVRMSRFGATLIRPKDSILTHCNTGALATVGIGTALGVVYQADRKGKRIQVFIPETRPLLQGARLTAWELKKRRVPATVICDSVVGDLFRQKKVDKVFVGADRIARNGDTANKIGTYTIAALAKSHRIPFYVVAPQSSFDFSILSGKRIPIEERSSLEVVEPFGVRVAPKGIRVYNPAFDVTPAHMITAFVTDEGIFYPPFKKSLRRLKTHDET